MTQHYSIPSFYKIIIILLFFTLNAAAQYPDAVEQNLKKAEKNRPELEKAILHCKQTGDLQKLKAIYFLISNMDIHYSADYYWKNTEGQKIEFNELDYPDFDQAAKAFEELKTKHPDLKPQSVVYKDLETIKADFLIENIEQAFATWKKSIAADCSFETFCEYILPYRASVEPLQEWRTVYAQKYNWLNEKMQEYGLETSLAYVKDEVDSWYTNTWNFNKNNEPISRLGSRQLLLRKKGGCEDLADLAVFTMRSAGIPSAIDVIPYWATATGSHLTTTFFGTSSKPIPTDFGDKENAKKLKREPTKVLRYTFSKQAETVASIEKETNIPSGFLKDQNYIDVTDEYWATTDVKCALVSHPENPKTVFLTTFNGLRWKPFWWAKVDNNSAQFKKICKGTVILPQYYSNQKMIPAANPILIGQTENKILTPNYQKLQNITISSAAGYLLIKPKVTYKLFCWDKTWKLIDSKTADENTISLLYEKAPKNALFLLLASDSKGFERPFIVDETGQRTWY
jgi:hypothetical protein